MNADGTNPRKLFSGEAHIGDAGYTGGRPAWKPK
jgi:hypothetical protein